MPKGTRILLVEGRPALRTDLKALLAQAGYAVITAPDGHEALAHPSVGLVDIIIFDSDVLAINGDTLREILRLRPSTMQLPFILISSDTPPSIDSDIAFGFLKKPIVINELISNIEKLMARYAVSRQRAPD